MGDALFITVEGGDGAGKSTLIDALAGHLRSKSKEVLCTREPGGTRLSEEVREILLKSEGPIDPVSELLLFLAARAEHLSEVILPALKSGKVVICDRFNDSTIAYQGVARGLGLEYARSLCKQACQNKEPDLTFYLDLDPKIALSRLSGRGMDRIEKEDLSFHQKVREGFLTLAKQEPDRIVVLNATLEPEDVFHKALESLPQALSL